MMEKVKKIYGAHPIAWTILALVVIVGVAVLGYYLPAFQLKAAEIPQHEAHPTAKGEEIPVGGVVTVAQSGGRTLTLDTENMILNLKDDASGVTWSSEMAGAASDNLSAKALMLVTFRGEDNTETTWNTYQNCVAFKDYRLFRIENGVRIELDVNEGDSKVYLEYLPERFPADRYENFILPAVDKLLAEGKITDKQHTRYMNILSLCYRKNLAQGENSYDKSFSGTSPAPSDRDALITLTTLIGYTREMLIEDCAQFGVTPEFHEPAQFNVTAEFVLDNGELVASIPTEEITTGNDFYRVQRISLLPNFVAVPASPDADGYIITPDGSGALMRFNTFSGGMTRYDRPFMDNDYYADYYYQSEYAEELRMPLFGVINGVEPSTHGMLAVVESGADTANLHVSLGMVTGTGKKAVYTGSNAAYVSIDTLEHASVRVNGAYETSSPTYVSDSGHINVDFTVRYKPYAKSVTYFDMAMDYRDYLAARSGVEIKAPQGPMAYVEVLGGVTLTDRFIGIPYDNVTSMSTFADVQTLVEELPAGSVIQYDGAFNGGVISELNDGARLVGENGTLSEMKALLEAAEKKGTSLYWQVNLSRVYNGKRSYVPYFHALRDYGNDPAEVYLYTPDTAMFNGRWDPIRSYTRISPKYLDYISDAFLAGLKKQGLEINLALGDLGHDVFVDYRYQNIINTVQANELVDDTLTKLAGAAALSLNDVGAATAPMADYVVNVSRRSSEYASFYCTIPFRQLALSGLTNLVGQDVNLNSRSLDYYLLQAAELGMSVKYTVSMQNPDVLKSSHFEGLYAAYWQNWKDEIIGAAEKCAELRGIVGGQPIVNHELLGENVFQTTYGNGVRVITNYTALPFETADGVVEAGTYLLVQEGGAQ